MNDNEKGFSLIEVMIALVILVVGLVGIFNLHVVAKRSSFEALQQTQASYYANDIINRMTLNSGVLNQYAGTYTTSSGTSPNLPQKNCDTININCSKNELKQWDLYQWMQEFSGSYEQINSVNVGGLDTPTACIDVAGHQVTVVMTWRGINEISDGGDAQTDCGISSNRRRVYVVDTIII